MLLGEAAPPPAELLHDLHDAESDLAMVRQNQYLARLLGHVESAEKKSGSLPAEIEERIRRILSEHAASLPAAAKDVLSVEEAAGVLGVSLKTLQNRISEAKRSGRELPWVLRAGRKRGCAVHRERFHLWLEQQPRRRGRPAGR